MAKINVYSHVKEIVDCTYINLQQNIRNEGDELIATLLKDCTEQEKPSYFHVAGIPCSGKSTFIKNNLTSGLFGKSFVIISFDEIMLNLEGYKNDLASVEITTKNLAILFAKYEMPARIIGYELLQQAVNGRMNIVFENSGSFFGNLNLMEMIKKSGYTTIFYSIECTKKTALARVDAREKIEQRHTPKQMIEARFKLYEELKSKYKNMANKTVTHTS